MVRVYIELKDVRFFLIAFGCSEVGPDQTKQMTCSNCIGVKRGGEGMSKGCIPFELLGMN